MSITRRGNATGITMKALSAADFDFTPVATTVLRTVVEGATDTVIDRDVGVVTDTGADVATEAVIEDDVPLSLEKSYVNLAPGIATIDSAGRLTRVADGTARIIVRTAKVSKLVAASILLTDGTVSVEENRQYQSGSLALHITEAMDALGAGKTGSETTMSLATGATANTNLWTETLDLSCIVVGHSGGFVQGCLVAPDVVCVARHVVELQTGDTFTFRGTNGTLHTRTVTAIEDFGDYDGRMVRLNAELTTASHSVTFAKVLPENCHDYWRQAYAVPTVRPAIPALKVHKVGGFRIAVANHSGPSGLGSNSYDLPQSTDLASFFLNTWGTWVTGDSGSPAGLLINGQFVFLGCAWLTYAYSSVLDFYAEANAAMIALGSIHQLTDVSLNTFTDFTA